MTIRPTLVLTLSVFATAPLAAQEQFRTRQTSLTLGSYSTFTDLDGDGDQDLLEIEAGVVEWHQNDGSGRFGPPITALGPATPAGLTVGDFDGDGDDDVAVFGTPLDQSLLLLNDGSAVLQASPLLTTLPTGPLVGAIVASTADVDGDGDLDLAAIPALGNVFVLLNDGSGGFTEDPTAISGTALVLSSRIHAMDFDGDGDTDILTDSPATLFLNDGAGNFTATPQNAGFTASRAADLNGDGIADLAGISGPSLYLYFGKSGGTLTPAGVTPLGGFPLSYELVVGDLDDDGDADILVSVPFGNPPIRTFVNDGAGVFADESATRSSSLPPRTGVIALGDIDGDGDSDALLFDTGQGMLAVNHHRQIAVPAPATLGSSLRIELSYEPGYGDGLGLALPVLGPSAPALPTPYGNLWIEPSAAISLPFALLPGPIGEAFVQVAVPNDPSLIGGDAVVQAVILEPLDLSAPIRLTGFETVTIQ